MSKKIAGETSDNEIIILLSPVYSPLSFIAVSSLIVDWLTFQEIQIYLFTQGPFKLTACCYGTAYALWKYPNNKPEVKKDLLKQVACSQIK